jgi:hypothetical protein
MGQTDYSLYRAAAWAERVIAHGHPAVRDAERVAEAVAASVLAILRSRETLARCVVRTPWAIPPSPPTNAGKVLHNRG